MLGGVAVDGFKRTAMHGEIGLFVPLESEGFAEYRHRLGDRADGQLLYAGHFPVHLLVVVWVTEQKGFYFANAYGQQGNGHGGREC